jgi:diguanylate cyclase (GGDEF)-like protein
VINSTSPADTLDPRLERAPSVRTFRLRLLLVVLAVSVLPAFVAAPILGPFLGASPLDPTVRAQAQSVERAQMVSDRLDRTRVGVLTLAHDTALRELAYGSASSLGVDVTASRAATASLDAELIPQIAILDSRGVEKLRLRGSSSAMLAGGPEALSALVTSALEGRPDTIHRSAAYDVGGDPRVAVAAQLQPLSSGWASPGVSVVELSLGTVLMPTGAPTPGTAVRLVEAFGSATVAQSAAPVAAVPATGDESTEISPNTHVGSIAIPVKVPGFEDYTVVVSDPRLPAPRPIEMTVALALFGLATLLFAAWLVRQMINQVRTLEGARVHLGKLYRSARQDALRDVLTGLGNHRAFQEEFDRELDHGRRYGTPVGLLLIDLDDFKMVNDSAGHEAGDDLLSEMGRLVLATMRKTDRAFRVGGDEFAVLMPHTDAEAGFIMGRRLLAATLQPRINTGFTRPFSFSAGVSGYPELGQTRRQLFAQADAAVYSSKRHGRTAVEIFDPNRNRDTLEEAVKGELSAAVADVASQRALHPVYQPIIDLSSGKVLGYEGLVRPVFTTIFADAGTLFAAAEAAGRTIELDQACLDAVAAGARGIPDDRLLTINISPRTLEAPEFNANGLIATLTRYGLRPERVVLELTEREAVEDLESLRRNLAACQAAGIRIAADDVGAGNAGLRLLSQIHFDIVKIDLSLVQGGAMRESSLAILRSLRDLAGRWGAMVIAEGVETPEQLRMLRDLGITAGQGYLLGRPSETIELQPLGIEELLRAPDRRGSGFRQASFPSLG